MGGRRVLQFSINLDEMFDRIHAETVDADFVQPVIGDLEHFLCHGGVVVIQVGHAFPEVAVIIAILCLVPIACAGFLRPDVVIAIGRIKV